MIARLQAISARFDGTAARRIAWVTRIAFFAGVIAWLVLKVRAIGWQEVVRSLPVNPWFYILFVVMFLALPLSETLIFRLILGRRMPGAFPVFIRKRIYNSAFVGYSGEVYFFVWARRHLGTPARQILLGIKDNAILSAVASALVTSALLVGLVASGQAKWIADWLDSRIGLLVAMLLVALFVTPLAIRFRRQLLKIAGGTALIVLGIHMLRIGAVVLLQATQWAVVLPSEPWSIWLLFVTTQMVISRLPLVPNRDLLFLSAALELSHAIDGPREAMAGLLLAGGALTQGSNLIFYLLTSFGQKPPLADPDVVDPAEYERARIELAAVVEPGDGLTVADRN